MNLTLIEIFLNYHQSSLHRNSFALIGFSLTHYKKTPVNENLFRTEQFIDKIAASQNAYFYNNQRFKTSFTCSETPTQP
jgi:hypothetical protein